MIKNSEKKLIRWFRKLTPEQRLSIALELEDFRRGAKFVKSRRDIRRAE